MFPNVKNKKSLNSLFMIKYIQLGKSIIALIKLLCFFYVYYYFVKNLPQMQIIYNFVKLKFYEIIVLFLI